MNVQNYSYDVAAVRTGEHTYTVTVKAGEPISCTVAKCRSGPCKHPVAVADNPSVITEAMRLASMYALLVAWSFMAVGAQDSPARVYQHLGIPSFPNAS